MPLIDPNYLRQAAMAKVNQGLLPAVGDEDYAAMLERLRQDYGIGPTDTADGGEVGNILDTQPTDASGLVGQDSLDQGAMDKVNVGLQPAVPMMGRGPRPPGAEPERKYLMEDKWQPPVTDWQDQVKGVVDKLPPPLFSEGLIPGTNPIGMARGVAEQVAQLHDTGVEVSRGQQISHPALAAFNAITMAPIPGARIAKEAEQVTQTAKPFFSQLRQAVEAAPFSKAPGKQWLGRVQNTPGVKLDELDWTGFKKWAEATPLATKEEALAHLDDNAIDVQEVIKGGDDQLKLNTISDATDEDGMRSVRLQDQTGRFWDAEADPGKPFHIMDMGHDPNNSIVQGTWQGEPPTTIEGVQDAIRRHAQGENVTGQATHGTKFSQWQLPGGENYRELLLTMPEKQVPDMDTHIGAASREMYGADFSQLNHVQKSNVLSEARSRMKDQEQPVFRSGHYDEPNVLAHMRFNDRVDANGKKTLFIEEIQSDWHQKGRKHGYPLRQDEKDRLGHLNSLEKPSKELAAERDALQERARRDIMGGTVPDAPFKKDWHELALKRAIKYAADNGYDQIAWTPGAVQAERYDLSKQIREIEYIKQRDGSYKLGITQHNGEGFDLPQATYKPDELADVVGKEVAEKIVAGEGKSYRGHEGRTLEGLDLKVGGEGMKGFYDKMLPDAANKIGKKYGAKVGTTKIGGAGTPRFNVITRNGQRIPFETEEQAREFARGAWGSGGYPPIEREVGGGDVWTLPITPPLKEQAIKKGFPVSALEDLTRAVG